MSELHTVSAGGEAPQADVIFVHGFGGDPFATWWHDKEQPRDSWPFWLAADQPEVAVHCLEYPANWTNWFGGEAMPLFDRAKSVLNLLAGKGLGRCSLIFICHSLGGLVVKQMLREGADSTNERWAAIAERTQAIVFVGTPHFGAALARVAQRLGVVLQTSPVMSDLELHAASLRGLNEAFRRQVERSNVRVLCYYEGYKTKTKRLRFLPYGVKVVEPGDADPGLTRVDPVPLDGDHFQICKPKGGDRPICLDVADLLRDLLGQPERRPALSMGSAGAGWPPPEMPNIAHVKTALEAFARGQVRDEDQELVRRAISTGILQISNGDHRFEVAIKASDATIQGNVTFGPIQGVGATQSDARREPATAYLPADLPDFTGRDTEVEVVEAALRAGGPAAIIAIAGMGALRQARVPCRPCFHVAPPCTPSLSTGRCLSYL